MSVEGYQTGVAHNTTLSYLQVLPSVSELISTCKRIVKLTEGEEEPSLSGIQCELFEFMPTDLALSFARCFYFTYRMLKGVLVYLGVTDARRLIADTLDNEQLAMVSLCDVMRIDMKSAEAIILSVKAADLTELYWLLKTAGPDWPVMDPALIVCCPFSCEYSTRIVVKPPQTFPPPPPPSPHSPPHPQPPHTYSPHPQSASLSHSEPISTNFLPISVIPSSSSSYLTVISRVIPFELGKAIPIYFRIPAPYCSMVHSNMVAQHVPAGFHCQTDY